MPSALTLPAPAARRPPRAVAVPAGTAAVVAGLWAVPAAVAVGQVYLDHVLAGRPVAWGAVLWTTLPNWALWALLTLPVAVLAARFAPGRAPVPVLAAVHLAGFAVAAGVHAAGNVAVFRWAGLPSDWSWATFQTHYALRVHVNALAYGLVVAGTWAALALRRVRERERAEADLRAELAEAELRALQMQVHPHFLFNALHAIGVTVRKGDGDGAVTMLRQLGDLLRFGLEQGGERGPLQRELDVLGAYLALEGVRFGDRLRLTWDVAPAARGALVPPWVLQPLVENALKHAVGARSGTCAVAVRARVEDGELRLAVEDDGPGLGGIGGGMARGARAAPPSTGIGLANLRARLAAGYGAGARLALGPGPDGRGVAATVALPYPPA